MKGKIILILMIFVSNVLLGQNIKKFYKWDISISYALQEHDKRMFDWPIIPAQAILNRQPERWGTHWYGITVNRNILESENFRLKIGLGYLTEYQTFLRPYNGCLFYKYDERFCPDVLWSTSGYKIKMINVPIDYNYRLFAGLNVHADFEGNFSFYKNPESKNLPFGKGLYHLRSFSFTFFPGISYTINKIHIKLDYRAFQIRRLDELIFFYGYFRTSTNPINYNNYEGYNPKHFRLTLSYEFGKREFEE